MYLTAKLLYIKKDTQTHTYLYMYIHLEIQNMSKLYKSVTLLQLIYICLIGFDAKLVTSCLLNLAIC